jgi:hypothetical protein
MGRAMSNAEDTDGPKGRIRARDFERLARKSAKEAAGEYELTRSSADAWSEIVPAFLDQQRADRKGGGSKSRRLQRIWTFTEHELRQHPNDSAKAVWARFPEPSDEDDPEIYRDGDEVFEVAAKTLGETQRIETQKSTPLKFRSWYTGYYLPIKKKTRSQ